jgi:hypothetical protein
LAQQAGVGHFVCLEPQQVHATGAEEAATPAETVETPGQDATTPISRASSIATVLEKRVGITFVNGSFHKFRHWLVPMPELCE